MYKSISILITSMALLVCSAMFVSCKRGGGQDAPLDSFVLDGGKYFIPENSALRERLQVATVEERLIESAFSAPASVEADPARMVKFHAPMPGRIVQIHAKLGASVTKGQALVTIDSPELAQLNAEYLKAKSEERQGKRNLDRVAELFSHDIASKREMEEAETGYASQRSELGQLETRLTQLGVQPGDISGGILLLRSPIDGKVCELEASNGVYWNDPGAALMVVADLSNVYFTASVQERDISKLRPGQEVKATVASFPDEVFSAKVVTTGELLDPETRTVKVRLPVENRGLRLLPSMFATASFVIKPYKGVVVPTSAVLHDAKGSKVFVELSPWTFEERVVQIGINLGHDVEITNGLKAGERIVAREGVLLHVH